MISKNKKLKNKHSNSDDELFDDNENEENEDNDLDDIEKEVLDLLNMNSETK